MRAVIIDDERPALDELTYLLKKSNSDIIGTFTSPSMGLEFVLREKPDVVFLDIDMPEISGLELGLKIQSTLPAIIIVFVTAYSQYALEAFRAYPMDYILKPVDEVRFSNTIEHIRKRLADSEKITSKKPLIKCFGKFEFFMDNKPVKFQTQKSKELLAFLLCSIDMPVFRDELSRMLFDTGDEKNDSNNFRVTMYRLRNAFINAGIKKEHLLIREDLSVVIDDGVCDYVDFIRFTEKNKLIDRSNVKTAISIIETINGELLSDIDAVWATEIRERMMVKAENLMIKTSIYCFEIEKKPFKAEKILLRLAENDPLSENGQLALLDLYIKTRDTEKYRFYYRSFAKMLDEEFGTKPSKKYSDYYEKILPMS